MPALSPEHNLLVLYPDVAAPWHPTKNMDRQPEHFTPANHQKVWWKCARNHEWKALLGNRTRGRGCPYCGGKLPTPEYNLLFCHPGIAKEWHPEKNGDRKPEEFLPRSNKKVWWLCDQGHVWKSTIKAKTLAKPRIGRTSGCPHCRLIKIPSLDNQLRLLR